MSRNAITRALETRLGTLSGGLPIAWENSNFNPPAGAYLSSFILFTEPDDRGGADAPYLQRGIHVIGLHFPTNVGPGNARTKAEDIAAHFKKGLSLAVGGVTTIVERTPEITGGAVEEGRYVIRVRVRFFAQIDPLQAAA